MAQQPKSTDCSSRALGFKSQDRHNAHLFVTPVPEYLMPPSGLCDFSSRVSDAPFWPLWALHAHGAQTYMEAKIKRKKIKENTYMVMKRKIFFGSFFFF